MSLGTRIQAIVEGKDRGRWPATAALLKAFSVAYGAVVKKRADLYRRDVFASHRLACKVVSVGNLTTGGTGKTPMVCYVARLLHAMGKRVVVVSRGYKGRYEKEGGLVSDGQRILLPPADAGDEPCMMARSLPGIPFLVGQDRVKSGRYALQHFSPDVIVLDDGFQHLRIRRDLDLLLLDAQRPYGNGHMLPRGNLREPMAALNRAHALILTRSQAEPPPYYPDLVAAAHPRPVFRAFHTPAIRGVVPRETPFEQGGLPDLDTMAPDRLRQKKVMAFSGIADNGSFVDTVRAFHADLVKARGFDDHHPYTVEEIRRMGDEAAASGCACLATSEKDFMRMPAGIRLPLDLVVMGVDIAFKTDQDALQQFVINTLFGTAGAPEEIAD